MFSRASLWPGGFHWDQQFCLCTHNSASTQVCTSEDVNIKERSLGVPVVLSSLEQTCQHCPWTVPTELTGIGKPKHRIWKYLSLELFFQTILQHKRRIPRVEVRMFLPLPKCQRCLWCHFYSRRVVWCNCSQQHYFFQEQDLLLPFLPSPESAQQSTKKETKIYLNTDHNTLTAVTNTYTQRNNGKTLAIDRVERKV